MASAYKKSRSGYYKIKLKSSWEHEGFLYKPSHSDITVNEAILEAAIAAGVADSITPVD
jgi:hypothetical protein